MNQENKVKYFGIAVVITCLLIMLFTMRPMTEPYSVTMLKAFIRSVFYIMPVIGLGAWVTRRWAKDEYVINFLWLLTSTMVSILIILVVVGIAKFAFN